MIEKLYIVLIMVVSCVTVVVAQHPTYWSLTTEDGLPTNEVYDLHQDSKGYMWIATDKGLCRYNGRSFDYFANKDQKGQSVTHIQETSDGRIWVMSFKNELFYVENDSLYVFEPISSYEGPSIRSYLIDDQNRIWIIGVYPFTKVYYYDLKQNKWIIVYNNGFPRTILKTSKGQIMVATENKIVILEGDSVISDDSIDEIYKFVPDEIYYSGSNNKRFSNDRVSLLRVREEIFLGN